MQQSIGDLLNAKNITWGWFASGFRIIDKAATDGDGNKANCDGPHKQQHTNIGGITTRDYFPLVEPFQYYKSTALSPNSIYLALIR